MHPTTLFYIIISIIVISFIIEKAIDIINEKYFDKEIPLELKDVYDEKTYKKSQSYKKTKAKFSYLTSSISVVLTLAFFFVDGFYYIDNFARSYSSNPIVVALIFFGIILLGSAIISTPASYYSTFVIEEKFGFNKTTIKTFWLDKIKGLILSAIISGVILSFAIWFYNVTGKYFWIYTWILIGTFTLFINMFHAKLILPLFNKQTPLEEGELKNAIQRYSEKVGFKISKIYVIDGSKRSTKANAYFSGFGSQKRITLYDTLVNDLNTDEIIAVLAHEVGHYKKNHLLFNIFLSVLLTGLTLYILSIFINSPILSESLGVDIHSFHIGLIAFGVLYSPISGITSLISNIISRKFEYQADNYAKDTFASEYLISSLKKLSKNNLINLTVHPAYVFVHYSHPTLLSRIKNLKKLAS